VTYRANLVRIVQNVIAPSAADHAGMGLRGTVATCVEADPVRVPASNELGPEAIASPWFLVLGAAVSLGLMEGALAAAVRHLGGGDESVW